MRWLDDGAGRRGQRKADVESVLSILRAGKAKLWAVTQNRCAKNNFRSKSGKMMVEFVKKEIKDARIARG